VICRSVTVVSPVQTAEPIEMPFGIWTGWAQEACIRWSAHRRHLANTTEPSMCGADAVCCQITLTTCSSVVTMTLSCIVSRMQRDIGQTMQFFIPPVFGTPVEGDSIGFSSRSLTSENWTPRLPSVVDDVIMRSAVLIQQRRATDRRTDRWTDQQPPYALLLCGE